MIKRFLPIYLFIFCVSISYSLAQGKYESLQIIEDGEKISYRNARDGLLEHGNTNITILGSDGTIEQAQEGEQVQTIINRLLNEGWELVSTTENPISIGSSAFFFWAWHKNITRVRYIFVRERK